MNVTVPPGFAAFRAAYEMGIGTDQQAYRPPQGWTPPPRPDPMTQGHKPARRKR